MVELVWSLFPPKKRIRLSLHQNQGWIDWRDSGIFKNFKYISLKSEMMWENRNPLSQLEYLTNHAADALDQGSFCMSKFETTAPRDFELIFYFGSLSSVLSHLGGCEMFLINSWRRIQQDRVLQQLWASNSLPGICLTCSLFCMTIKLKVKERKKQKTRPKIWLNPRPAGMAHVL